MLDKFFSYGLDLLALVLPVSIAATNIVFFPLAAVWLFGARWTFRKWPPAWGWPEVFFLVYLGSSVLSALFGLDPRHSLFIIEKKDFYIVIAVVLVALVHGRDQQARLLKIFMGAGIATAIWGLVQCVIGVSQTDKSNGLFLHLPLVLAHWPRPILDLLSLLDGRVMGTRSHPLFYSECLLFNWAFAICFLLTCAAKDLVKWMIAIVLLGAALLASQSRGPWIAAAAIVFVAIVTSSTRRAWLLVGLCALFISTFATIPALRDRAVSISDKSFNSNKERVHMWHAGLQLWKSHPLLGIGPGNVKRVSADFQTPEERIWGSWGHLHSIYINFLAERGSLGLLGFFLMIGAYGRELWQAKRRASGDPWRSSVFQGCLLGILGFLISGLTEAAYNTAVVMMTFYFVTGIALSMSRNEKVPGS